MTPVEKVAVQRSLEATQSLHMPGPCLSPPSFSVVESTVLLLQTSDKDNSSEKPLSLH